MVDSDCLGSRNVVGRCLEEGVDAHLSVSTKGDPDQTCRAVMNRRKSYGNTLPRERLLQSCVRDELLEELSIDVLRGWSGAHLYYRAYP